MRRHDKRKLERFGGLLAMDHCDAADKLGNQGIGGSSAFLIAYGFATDTIGVIAVKDKGADSTATQASLVPTMLADQCTVTAIRH